MKIYGYDYVSALKMKAFYEISLNKVRHSSKRHEACMKSSTPVGSLPHLFNLQLITVALEEFLEMWEIQIKVFLLNVTTTVRNGFHINPL